MRSKHSQLFTALLSSYNGPKVSDPVKMYDQDLVKEIMISAALCVHEMLKDDPHAREDDIYDFIESNFRQIIDETLLAEREAEETKPEDPLFPA